MAESPPAERSRWLDGAAVFAAFSVPFLVYLRTLSPSPAIGDSTEFVLVSHFFGIAHTTGYPLYILLAGVWERLVPIGSIAYRGNLFSAVLAAGACAVVAYFYLRLLGHRVAAVLAAYVTAFSSVFWGTAALVADVFALHCVLVGLVMVAFLHWQRARTERSLVWLALAAGLALSHHRIAVFVSAPFLLAPLLVHRPLRPALVGKAVLAGLAPFLFYAYLPMRAQADPVVIWGDCKTLAGLWHYETASEFFHFLQGRTLAEFLAFEEGAARATLYAMTWVGVALAAAGWTWLWFRNRLFWVCSTLAFALTAVFAGEYGVLDEPTYLISDCIFIGIWAAAGAQVATLGIEALGKTARRRRAVIARWVVPAALLLLPYYMASANLGLEPEQVSQLWGSWYAKHLLELNLSKDWEVYDDGQAMLAETDRNAVMLVQGHGSYTILLYLQLIEGRRPDVTILSREMIYHDYYRARQKDPLLRHAMDEARRVYDTGILGAEPDWGRVVVGVMASRVQDSRPFFTNAEDISLLPPGYHALRRGEGDASIYQVVYGDPLPRVARRGPVAGPATPLDFGIGVAEARVLGRPREGRVAPITFKWVCSQPVEFPLRTRLWMVHEEALESWRRAVETAGGRREALEPFERVAFSDAEPFVYGIVPVETSAPGTYYEQTVCPVIPRGLTPGRYAVLVSLETPNGFTAPKWVARFTLGAGTRR